MVKELSNRKRPFSDELYPCPNSKYRTILPMFGERATPVAPLSILLTILTIVTCGTQNASGASRLRVLALLHHLPRPSVYCHRQNLVLFIISLPLDCSVTFKRHTIYPYTHQYQYGHQYHVLVFRRHQSQTAHTHPPRTLRGAKARDQRGFRTF